MSVLAIEARIECDGCGRRFAVSLEEAYKPPADWTLFEVAVDAVRGGDPLGDGTGCSVHGGSLLCKACTVEADSVDAEVMP